MSNTLYYGDNLDVLRRHVDTETVDLVYLDPPFNSNATYNVLFRSPSGAPAEAQAEAFKDTWHWGPEAEYSYDEVLRSGSRAAGILRSFRSFLGENDMMAYLANMAARLIEMHRVLKPTGSLYLHCDPTASHYLKVVLDGIFDARNFRNEISWKRSSAHSDTKQGMRRCGKIRDVLLFYTKTAEYVWNPVYTPYDANYVSSEYRHIDETGRQYKETDLTAAKPGGDTNYAWWVKRPKGKKGARWTADLDAEHENPRAQWEYLDVRPYQRRFWAYSKENMCDFAREGRLIHRKTGMPRLKQFADEMPGVPLQDSWDDITPASGREDTGYPTQKPLALLERIVKASSENGGIVLDPFCGCGTTLHAAQSLDRQWIGIDITHYAVTLIENRLRDHFPSLDLEVKGRPRDLSGARDLAERDKYQFQWWATWLLGAHAFREGKKGADGGVDGIVFFKNGPYGTGMILISVKGGQTVNPSMIRDLHGTIEREGAEMGIFVTLAEPSPKMVSEAAAAGFVRTAHGRFPRIQVATIEELLAGRYPEMPEGHALHSREEMRRAGGSATKAAKDDAQLSFALPIPGGKSRKTGKVSPDANAFISSGRLHGA